MFRILSLLLTLITLNSSFSSAVVPNKILVRLQLAPGDSSNLQIDQYEIYSGNSFVSPQRKTLFKPGSMKIVSWEFTADRPIGIRIRFNEDDYYLILDQGNDITIKTLGGKLQVSGLGSEMFDALSKELLPQLASLTTPPNVGTAGLFAPLKSKAEFDDWNTYLDRRSEIVHRIIDKYTTLYPSGMWNLLKANYLVVIEERRWDLFTRMSQFKNHYNLTRADIKAIYDSVIFNKNFQWLLKNDGEISLMDRYLKFTEVILELSYPALDETVIKPNKVERIKLQLGIIDSLVTGRLKDEMLAYQVLDKIISTGATYIADDLLPLAFSMIDRLECKNYIKRNVAEGVRLLANEKIADFYLLDINGKPVRRKNMNYKTLIFHINDPRFSQPDRLFQEAIRAFGTSPEVILAEIGYGPNFEEWQKTTIKRKSGNTSIQSFYAPQTGDYRDFIQNIYNVNQKQTMVLYQYKSDVHQNLFTSSRFQKILKDQGTDTISAVLEAIHNEINRFDGPHIRIIKDTTFIHTIAQSRAYTDTLLGARPALVKVQTDIDSGSFNVTLNEILTIPATRYPMPEKTLFVSDIEGNFNAFRELLLKNSVIDSAYNWIFDKGHLVVTGDVFDRGRQVTSSLWLIYHLENKARTAGGDVHFILGNHEIMNFRGNLAYVHPDYLRFAEMLGLNYMDFHAPNSVLGQWLRSKNIIEIIGDNLVVHGGISPQMNSLGLSAETINDKHRDFLAGYITPSSDTTMEIILSSQVSPYWYRGYYASLGNQSPIEEVVDNTLEIFRVNRIITGHTVVPDVSAFYGGKVVNTDTRHATGDSEGLLIENNVLYRVTTTGIKAKLPQ